MVVARARRAPAPARDRELGLIDERGMAFLWVTDFPMLEWDEDEERWAAKHHPFTRPTAETGRPLSTPIPARAIAHAYDLVGNGNEIGGGSFRIHEPELQARMFDTPRYLEPEEQRAKFGFLLDALAMGAPPHGGIAFGIDRMAMVLADEPNLRDVDRLPEEPGRSRPDDRCADRGGGGTARRARHRRGCGEGVGADDEATDAAAILSELMASERGQQASLTPLPNVEELPTLGDGGYDPERVKEAFESFRRHTTQLQVQLRVLQAAARGGQVEPSGHAVRMDALHMIRAAADMADTIERDAQTASAAQVRRTEEEVSRRQRELQEREHEVERFRQESERQRAEILNAARNEAREAQAEAQRHSTAEIREAEARANRLLEQARHQATELTNSARAEVEQTLEWARAQASAVMARAQEGAEQLLAAAGLGDEAIAGVASKIVEAAQAELGGRGPATSSSGAGESSSSAAPSPPTAAPPPRSVPVQTEPSVSASEEKPDGQDSS